MIVKSQKLRRSAQGEDCTARIPGVCNFNPETVVLAHLPCGQKGMGMKGFDTVAIYACSSCHDLIDGRAKGDVDARDLLRAVAETHLRMIAKGLLKVAA